MREILVDHPFVIMPSCLLLSVLRLTVTILSLLFACDFVLAQNNFDDDDEEGPLFFPGLAAAYTGSDGRSHQRLDEVVSMSWGAGAPDLRIPAGKFSVHWAGRLQVWNTGEYRFRLFTEGNVTLKVDGLVVLDGQCDQADWLESGPIQIEWGERPIEIIYEKTGPEAQVSFYWMGPDFDWEPVASHSLMHDPAESPDDRFQRGHFLARALRCAACHSNAPTAKRIRAPALNRLPGAVISDWVVDWLGSAGK
jgi:hypothetical protein